MLYNLTHSEKIVLETIRKNNNSLKSKIVEKSNLPWATVSTAINSLYNKEWINFYGDKNETVRLNSDKLFFIGISIGSSNIKISITNLMCEEIKERINLIDITKKFSEFQGFKGQKEKSALWCFVTPNDYIKLSRLLSDICRVLLNYLDELTIASICFVFPGHIDIENQKIINSSYSKLQICASDIERILDSDVIEAIHSKNIHMYIDHNVKASAAYELSSIVKEENKDFFGNLAVIYLGLGLGMGIVINGQLYRGGSSNLAGQLGHNHIQRVSDEYINDYFNNDTEKFNTYTGNDIELEEILKNDIFYKLLGFNNDEDGSQKYRETQVEDLKKLLLSSDSLYRKKLAYYLGNQICNVVRMLSINNFVFSGKLAALYPAFKAELQYVIMKNECQVNINFIVSKNGEYSASLGAAEMAYRNTFNILNTL